MTAEKQQQRRGLTRRDLLKTSGAGLAGTALASAPYSAMASPRDGAAGRRPNFVFVYTDDLGYGELGCYGQEHIRTPHLDRLASEGVRFTNHYAGSPICGPSRCTLLTGLHVGHSTVPKNPFGEDERSSLRQEDVTFAEVLKATGYRTACYGKWGLGLENPDQPSHPNRRGFDEFFGYISHRHAHDHYPTYLWDNGDRVNLPENENGRKAAFAPDLFTDRALDFIERNRDDPFLLFLPTTLPHSPQDVPSLAPYEDRPWGEGEKAHAAQITRIDSHVGRIMDTLADLGLDEDTIVFFTSDNGPHQAGRPGFDAEFFDSNGGLRGYKRNLYEGGIRVPMIAWAPRILRRTAGSTSDHVWASHDVFPTLADFAGAPVPDDLDGISMRGALDGAPSRRPREHDYLYWFRLDRHVGSAPAREADRGRILTLCEAVRRDDWKAVRFAPGRDRFVPDEQWDVELYDLGTDPGETTNVAADHPEVALSMVALMHEAWEERPFERDVWSPEDLSVAGPEFLVAGATSTVTVTFTNHRQHAVSDVALMLDAPDGWRVASVSDSTFRAVHPGQSVDASWEVSLPAGTEPSPSGYETSSVPGPDAYRVRASASHRSGGRRGGTRLPVIVTVVPAAPERDTYLSDLAWISAANGYGPLERDMGNGRQGADDGATISLDGRTYDKGLGSHAPADVRYYLGGNGTRFVADVGIDDFKRPGRGRVTFYVFGDGEMLYDSGMLDATDPPKAVDVDISGVQVLKLTVEHATDSTADGHASWGTALVRCSDAGREP
ncbi:arylsulfatase A-like enzyme [Haloactinopolyspora alba]|uniref:Arylsulfatase A-like enzyme n=1 Tax=Haloactinopolyspora alba TaxID=648780 RepID=A0A2P8DX97_9ACTN|nr:sulfatase-like hydrolase/transferase [Haloactinopolyspora alba]PSL01834.1 arylsulfatase A-like enzyme [Haloactinopolyspora alba]